VTTAVVDPSVKDAVAGISYQFERLGFFVVDRDSRTDAVGGKLVFNRTATLRDGAGKPAATDTTTTNAKNAPGRR
jgi:glutaminyl-tRNA synthetase